MTLRITSVLLATTALLTISAPAYAQKIGVNAAIKNQVSIKKESEAASRPAVIGSDVALRDTITSGPDSALQVLLLDETTFSLGSQAELVVDTFVYDPDAGTGEMAARVTKGAFRFMSGRTARNPENVRIDTPVASMGVRGTIVEGAVGRDAIERLSGLQGQFQQVGTTRDATLIVLRGPGNGDQHLNRDGAVDITTPQGTVTLTKPNSAIFIPNDEGIVIGPFPLPPQTVRSFGADIVSVPQGVQTEAVPDVRVPAASELDEPPIAPAPDPEEEQVVDRPTIDCPIIDGIPITDGGLELDGSPGQVFDDFGGIEFGVECIE